LSEPLVVECDVTQPQQVEAMMKQFKSDMAASNFINNSGIIATGPLRKWRWTILRRHSCYLTGTFIAHQTSG